ncbi:MAG: MEKHLA domain-containing protein [Gallionella sp.]
MNTTDNFLRDQVALLRYSYHHWTGLHLVDAQLDDLAAITALRDSPLAVVSHDTAADPIFNYANSAALQLFEMDWDSFTRLPSRLSAETANQEKRGKALEEVAQQGYTQGYAGIRIASSGRRFWIRDTTIWNVVSPEGVFMGQAALIGRTEAL